jgi:hypothetical protein
VDKEKIVGVFSIILTLLIISANIVNAYPVPATEKGFFESFFDWTASLFHTSGSTSVITGAQVLPSST